MSATTIQEQTESAINDAAKGSGKVNIIIAGKTGVGKSTLINSVFRGELAKTGSGHPTTQKYRKQPKKATPLQSSTPRDWNF